MIFILQLYNSTVRCLQSNPIEVLDFTHTVKGSMYIFTYTETQMLPPLPSTQNGEKWFLKGTNTHEIYHKQELGTAAVKILDVFKCHDVSIPTKIRIMQAVLFSMEAKIGL